MISIIGSECRLRNEVCGACYVNEIDKPVRRERQNWAADCDLMIRATQRIDFIWHDCIQSLSFYSKCRPHFTWFWFFYFEVYVVGNGFRIPMRSANNFRVTLRKHDCPSYIAIESTVLKPVALLRTTKFNRSPHDTLVNSCGWSELTLSSNLSVKGLRIPPSHTPTHTLFVVGWFFWVLVMCVELFLIKGTVK